MNIRHAVHPLAVGALVLICAAATTTPPGHLVQGLRSSDRLERLSARSALELDRQDLVMGLIAIVRESPLVTDDTPLESEETSRVMAIQLLGRIRAAEAVPVLIQYVMLRTPRTWSDKLELSNIVYPAAESLARIGTPAVQPIIDGLQGDVPAAKRVVLVHILRRIEGADTAGYILDAPRKRIKDPFVQKHLGESLEILDKLSKRELILGAPATAPS